MGSDGSNLGVTAGRALKTILGGDPSPTEEEQTTDQQVEERIRATPLPDSAGEIQIPGGEDAYSYVTDCLAHVFVVLAEEEPDILDRREYYGTGEDVPEVLRGRPMSAEHCVWEALKTKWPETVDGGVFDGISGFMGGFAFNCARMIAGKGVVPNPAIVTIGVKEDEDGR